jgi:thioredoxin reductase (NADPH)
VENVVVIGSGPAGYTAAIYAARANLKPLLLEGFAAGVPGGQLVTTADVDNFPGFPDGVSGPALMRAMRAQAERAGAELVADDAVRVDLGVRPFEVEVGQGGTVRAHALIVATGASARRLRVPGEDAFWSRGISACAICDGAAPIYAGVELAVVGGGDSACEEAVYLTKYATRVHLLVRGAALRASKVVRDRCLQHPGVDVHFGTTVVEPRGSAESGAGTGSPLRAVLVRDAQGERELAVRGLFYAIGHTPNTKFLEGSGLAVDAGGYLVTAAGSAATTVPGVYAAGDVADSEWRQAVTAAGSGCMAALAVERWLTGQRLGVEYKYDEAAATRPGRAAVEAAESETERRTRARGDDDEATYSIDDTWHKGSFALRKLYHESSRPLVVKYVSPNCGPCGQLKPLLHSVVRGLEGRVHFVEVDITVDPEVAESAGVMGSPTVQVFFEKGLVKELRGVHMKSEYRKVIEGLL